MPTMLSKLRLHELSLVDAPANKAARVAIFKRESATAEIPAAILKYVGQIAGAAVQGEQSFAALLAANEADRRRWEAQEELWPLFSALQDSLRSIASDQASDASAKLMRIRESVAQFLGAVAEKLPEIEQELEKALRTGPAFMAGVFKAGVRAGDPVKKEGSMPGENEKITALESQIADLTKKLDDVSKAKDAAEKAKADAEAKAKDLEKAADIAKSDETFEAEGVTIRKSEVGGPTFAVLKAQAERIEIAEFAKAAEGADYGALPGETILKAKALRAVEKMGKDEGEALKTMLKAGAAAMKLGFSPVGKSGSAAASTGSADEKLEALAKAHAEKAGVSIIKARDEVLKTEDGARLYAESDAERRERVRAAA